MLFNQYFQSELLALKELGRDFSRKNPALAPFLSQDGRDPDVDRLFEGVAFIAGRLRQKLDDELPELSHSLLQLLWPNYLRPLPSFSMLEFKPAYQVNQLPKIPKGAGLSSRLPQATTAKFLTCYETELSALQISTVNFYPQGDAGVLQMAFIPMDAVSMDDIALTSLRLHFSGERAIACSLYFGVLQLTRRISLILKDEQGLLLEEVTLAPENIRPVGFGKEERLLDYPLNCFDGYLLLQEYFAFPQKFLFVEIEGLSVLQHCKQRKQAYSIELQFELSRLPMLHFQPHKEHVHLHCSPVVNVFKTHAIPIRYDQRQTEYRVITAEPASLTTHILSIDAVTGWLPGELGVRNFCQFESFRPKVDIKEHAYYRVRYKPGIGHYDTEAWLSFNNTRVSNQITETISVDLTCCDHALHEQIRIGDLCVAGDGMPQYASFHNIAPLSVSYPPPIAGDTLWRIISNMSLNYQSLANVQALRVILETYDIPGFYDDVQVRRTRKMLDGINQITQVSDDRIWQGLPIRGMRTEIEMDVSHFLCEGDMYLFAAVLNEFFCCFTGLNTFHQLQVTGSDGAIYTWAPRMGQQVLN